MPTRKLTSENRRAAERLQTAFGVWQQRQRGAGRPWSQVHAAARLGMGQSALSQYLRGQIPLNAEALAKICNLVGVDPMVISPTIVESEAERAFALTPNGLASLAHKTAAAARRVERPVVDDPLAHWPRELWRQDGAPAFTTSRVAQVHSADERSFVIEVTDMSLAPRFLPGEFALVEPAQEVEIEDDVLLMTVSGEVRLRRLLGLRGGVRLGTYAGHAAELLSPDEVIWMWSVAHAVPRRRIRPREPGEATSAV